MYQLASGLAKDSVSDIIAYNYGPSNEASLEIHSEGGDGPCDYPYHVEFSGVGGECGLWKTTNETIFVGNVKSGIVLDGYGPACLNATWNLTCWGFGKPVSSVETFAGPSGAGALRPGVSWAVFILFGLVASW